MGIDAKTGIVSTILRDGRKSEDRVIGILDDRQLADYREWTLGCVDCEHATKNCTWTRDGRVSCNHPGSPSFLYNDIRNVGTLAFDMIKAKRGA